MIISLLSLHYLGEAVDAADIPVMLVADHVEGRRVTRSIDVATRGGGGAMQSHSLSTCHPDGAPVLLEENAATVTKLVFLRLITKDRKIIVSLFVALKRKKIRRKSSPRMRPEVDMHAGKKDTCRLRRYVSR
jgi:hypothetical protein